MSKFRSVGVSASLVCTAVLASCGGGGDDEAGSATEFSISPATFTAEFKLADGCGVVNDVAEVLIVGGTAPYKVRSTTSRISVNQTSVPKGGSFKIGLTGGCVDPGLVQVEDELGRVATLTVTATAK